MSKILKKKGFDSSPEIGRKADSSVQGMVGNQRETKRGQRKAKFSLHQQSSEEYEPLKREKRTSRRRTTFSQAQQGQKKEVKEKGGRCGKHQQDVDVDQLGDSSPIKLQTGKRSSNSKKFNSNYISEVQEYQQLSSSSETFKNYRSIQINNKEIIRAANIQSIPLLEDILQLESIQQIRMQETIILDFYQGFDSIKGCGNNVPDPEQQIFLSDETILPLGKITKIKPHNDNNDKDMYSFAHNEYVVYDEAQVRIRYLVQIDMLQENKLNDN